MRGSKLFLSVLALTFMTSFVAEAATVKSVKGRKVLIDMELDKMVEGDIWSVIGKSGKPVGAVKIMKLKGNNAMAALKGKAEAGQKLKLKTKAKKKAEKTVVKTEDTDIDTSEKSIDSTPKPQGKSKIGAIVGVSSSSADIKLDTDTVALSGSGFSAKAFFDYPVFSFVWFRGSTGLEQFNVGGTDDTDCGGECTAEINYLSFDLWGRIVFGSGGMRYWVGGGFDLMFPLSKKATALDEESITNTSLFGFGGGIDIITASGSIFPIQVEYNMFPSTDNVDAKSLAVRVGYGWDF